MRGAFIFAACNKYLSCYDQDGCVDDTALKKITSSYKTFFKKLINLKTICDKNCETCTYPCFRYSMLVSSLVAYSWSALPSMAFSGLTKHGFRGERESWAPLRKQNIFLDTFIQIQQVSVIQFFILSVAPKGFHALHPSMSSCL